MRPVELPSVATHFAGTGKQFGGVVSKHIQKRWKKTIVVFVTANPKMIPDDFAGAHGVIPKPFSRNGFMSAMRYLVEGIIKPPPISTKPGEFKVAPALLQVWSEAVG